MSGRDREPYTVDGEPSRKVSVHDVRGGKDYGVVVEFDDQDEFLSKHVQNHGWSEHVLVRKRDQAPRWVPVEEYKKELRARKK
jgi:hypothetical protein